MQRRTNRRAPRHRVLGLALSAWLVLLLAGAGCRNSGERGGTVPPPELQAGDTLAPEVPLLGLDAFDQTIEALMEEYGVPGGALALAKDGRLVLAQAYGRACAGSNLPVRPDSLFRIASVSKPLTAVAILTLVEAGRLDLDDRAFALLDHLQPLDGETPDPRLQDITVRHLLQHSAGWDRGRSFDPMYSPRATAHLTPDQLPASCPDIIRAMLGRRLDFAPGTDYAYSNLGYCVLGEIIETLTGQSYEAYVQQHVLAPLGIRRMRVGGSLADERVPGEVCYYDYAGAPPGRSVFSQLPEFVPQPYGTMSLEATAANGGWIASTVDLLRFLLAVDGQPSPPDLLQPATVRQMGARPDLAEWQDSDYYYALGWEVSTDDERLIWSHDGAMPGTRSFLGRRSDGYAAAVLFNSDPRRGSEFLERVLDLLVDCIAHTTSWPQTDLFVQYGAEQR
jgi:N-acyl-D-amino-acid deacylase